MKKPGSRQFGFTLLELMISIGLFAMVLTAIYAIWHFIVKGTRVAMEASAETQRSRVAMQTMEDAFASSVMYKANIKNYVFLADTSGDMASVSMVSRLPETFPGVRRFEGLDVRRVAFDIRSGPSGDELMLTQFPILQDPEEFEPYRLLLAKNVTRFELEFWDLQKAEWLEEWDDTNQMPRMVKITLGLGGAGQRRQGNQSASLVSRVVSMPSMAVEGDIQGAGVPVPPNANIRSPQ